MSHGHIVAATSPGFLVGDWGLRQTGLNQTGLNQTGPNRTWENDDMEQPVYDAGVAGSVTMIFLTLATVILMRSFYKRWKRMDSRRVTDESK